MMLAFRLICYALLLLAACKDDDGSQPAPVTHGCSDDGDCDPQQLCVFGLCSETCTQVSDCKNGASCLDIGRGSACARLQDNACLTTANCPAHTRCIAGRCLAACETNAGDQCPSGERCMGGVCVSDARYSGGDGGSLDAPLTGGGSSSTAGAASAGRGPGSAGAGGKAPTSTSPAAASAGGTAPPAPCAGGSVRCSGNAVVLCKDDGSIEPQENCPFVCQRGACTGSCTPGTTRCTRQERQRCEESGTWQTLETCTSLCTVEGCSATCPEGSRRCDGERIVRCSSGQLIEETTCPFACEEGTCVGDCLPGARRCTSGATAVCGSDAAWMPPVACESGCADGSCTNVCKPGERRCAGGADFQTCGELGQWGESESCENKACMRGACSGTCAPGTARCASATSSQVCDANGQWGSVSPCLDQACLDGLCGGACMPTAKRCDPTGVPRVQTCSMQGEWQSEPNCPSGVCRVGACEAGGGVSACAPNARRCAPNDARLFQLCSAQGTWGAGQACPQNMSCTGAGECPSAPACGPGASPDWYSSAAAGGNRGIDDPRWGTEPPVPFETMFNPTAGGYIVIYNRDTQQLLVSIRITLGAEELPTAADQVFFAITPNVSGAPRARRLVFPLAELTPGANATSLTQLEVSALTDDWRPDTAPWVQNVNAWRGGPGANLSWAVSFRIDLRAAMIDMTKPFRLILTASLEHAPRALTTPAEADLLKEMPNSWALATIDPAVCIQRVALR